MKLDKNQQLRALPAVHEILNYLKQFVEYDEYFTNRMGLNRLTFTVRQTIKQARENILAGRRIEGFPWEWLICEIRQKLVAPDFSLRRVINGTGVILHTNCGRAMLAPEVASFVRDMAQGYSNLELDVKSGERGSRYMHIEQLIVSLTGAEAAMVVNNNAAAVLLIVNTFARNKEVIVSRGELVEIGGSFRIPEVLKAGGAQLVEVGTTNKTWLKDYEAAVTENTAMILKVHNSNYRIEGFTHQVTAAELAELGVKKGIPVIEDLGSGSFDDGSTLGLPAEPTIEQSVGAGLTLVTFSGDKLLGGPQAGIIAGKKEYIKQLKENQLTRALRIDKLTLAALEGTLRLYERGEMESIPVWRMLKMDRQTLYDEAECLAGQIEAISGFSATVKEDASQIGGGAWPTADLPTWVCAIRSEKGTADQLEKFLRLGRIPVLTRIHREQILIDPRTLFEGDKGVIVQRLQEWNP